MTEVQLSVFLKTRECWCCEVIKDKTFTVWVEHIANQSKVLILLDSACSFIPLHLSFQAASLSCFHSAWFPAFIFLSLLMASLGPQSISHCVPCSLCCCWCVHVTSIDCFSFFFAHLPLCLPAYVYSSLSFSLPAHPPAPILVCLYFVYRRVFPVCIQSLCVFLRLSSCDVDLGSSPESSGCLKCSCIQSHDRRSTKPVEGMYDILRDCFGKDTSPCCEDTAVCVCQL